MWRSVANRARSFVRPTLGLCGLTRLRITMTCNSRNLDSCHMDSSELVFTAPCSFFHSRTAWPELQPLHVVLETCDLHTT